MRHVERWGWVRALFATRSSTNPSLWWIGPFALTAVLGVAYLCAARLSLTLLTKPDGVAVFWPAAGIAAGTLIAFGSRARLPVAVGVFVCKHSGKRLGRSKLDCSYRLRPVQCGRALAGSLADQSPLR